MNNTVTLSDCLGDHGRAVTALQASIRRGAPHADLADAVRAARGELGPALPDELHAGIQHGLSTEEWDDAVAAFGDQREADRLCYVGPMLARDGQPASTGLVLGERDTASAEYVEIIENVADQLGAGLFGFACRFHGRKVEFYDLVAATGALDAAPEAPIAMFTPFYLAGWSDTDRQVSRRRTILFGNVVSARYAAIAGRILAEATVDGARPALSEADANGVRGAVAVWLTLHELMHGSGPAPFFDSWTGKSGIAEYGVIEEARVDMSAFLAASLLEDILPEARLAREMIVAERLFRSARRGLYNSAVGAALTLDDEHGLCWLNLALCANALESSADGLRIDLKALDGAVNGALRRIYAAEQNAAAAEDPAASLRTAAPGLREHLLTDRGIPDPGPLSAFLAGHDTVARAATLGAAEQESGE